MKLVQAELIKITILYIGFNIETTFLGLYFKHYVALKQKNYLHIGTKVEMLHEKPYPFGAISWTNNFYQKYSPTVFVISPLK